WRESDRVEARAAVCACNGRTQRTNACVIEIGHLERCGAGLPCGACHHLQSNEHNGKQDEAGQEAQVKPSLSQSEESALAMYDKCQQQYNRIGRNPLRWH